MEPSTTFTWPKKKRQNADSFYNQSPRYTWFNTPSTSSRLQLANQRPSSTISLEFPDASPKSRSHTVEVSRARAPPWISWNRSSEAELRAAQKTSPTKSLNASPVASSHEKDNTAFIARLLYGVFGSFRRTVVSTIRFDFLFLIISVEWPKTVC